MIPTAFALGAFGCGDPVADDVAPASVGSEAAALTAVAAGGTAAGAATTATATATATTTAATSPTLAPILSPDVRLDARGRSRVIVELRPDAGAPRVGTWVAGATDRLLGDLGSTQGRLQRRYQHLPYVALDVDGPALQQLARHPGVASVSPERQYEPAGGFTTHLGDFSTVQAVQIKPVLPKLPDLWEVLIGAPKVVDLGFDGTGQAIAILDSGVDKTHPYLNGSVVMEACFAEGGNCPNGQDVQLGLGAAPPVKTADGGGHGTHTAGIAVGRPMTIDGVFRLQGVAPGAQLVAIQVFRPVTQGCHTDLGEQVPCGRASTSDIIGGLDFVQFMGGSFHFAAVSMSLGGGMFQTQAACNDADPALRTAIRDVRNHLGAAIVASSGNNGFKDAMQSPACLDNVVSVGNVDILDAVISTSNSASFLTMLAPGTEILSSIPGGGFTRLSGTSMSAPEVAGAFALLKHAYPTATTDQIKSVLVSSGFPDTDGTNGLTRPRLDVFAAYNALGALLRHLSIIASATVSATLQMSP